MQGDPRRLVGRLAAVLAILAGLAVVVPAPALAHGRAVEATNYSSVVLAAPDGISAEIHGGDDLLEITTHGAEVVVLGYDDEPYLRITPDGIEENQLSPARWLNEDRYRTDLPADAAEVDPEEQPEWREHARGDSWAYHDHRTHFMSTERPPAVADAPDEQHLLQEWEVPLLIDGSPATIAGELRWDPGPSPWPWIAFGFVATLPALLGLRHRGAGPRVARPAVVVLGAVVALNTTRVVDDLVALPVPTSQAALAAGQTALFLIIATLGLWKAWRGGDGAGTALAVAGAAVLVGQGLLYLEVLRASQIASLLPDAFSRAVTALSVGPALSVGIVAAIQSRRQVPQGEPDAPDPAAVS